MRSESGPSGIGNVITYTVSVEANERTVYASREVGVILARCGAPRYLCHGEYARIYKVFRSTRLIHVFGPHIGLRAYHMALLLGRQPLGHGVERVDPLQREIPPYGYRLNLGSALIFVGYTTTRRGAIITSCPERAASTPPSVPRHDSIVADGSIPPSSISSSLLSVCLKN